MKALNLWVEIICWKCAKHCWGRWVRGSKIPASEFKQEARERGWRPTSGGEFECPTCTKSMLKEMITGDVK